MKVIQNIFAKLEYRISRDSNMPKQSKLEDFTTKFTIIKKSKILA